jgi:arsenite-transporting ATPase
VPERADRTSAEELTVPPGLDEFFSLLQIKRHHDGRFGCVTSTARRLATLRLLVPRRRTLVLQKVFPQSPQLMAVARLLRAMLDVPARRRRPRRRAAPGAQPSP